MSNVGEKIRELRESVGITQLQLADHAECTAQIISNIERGVTKPSISILNNIAEYFHVPSDSLLGKAKTKWLPLSSTGYGHIGKTLSELLKLRKISAEALAQDIEVEKEDLNEILNGNVTPNIDVLAKISKVLGTSIDYLIGISPYPTAISSEDEEDIVLYYRTLPKHDKRIFMGSIEKSKEI